MKCLSISDLDRLFSNPLKTDYSNALKKHLNSCPKCRFFLNRYFNSRKWLLKYKSEISKGKPTDKCLSPTTLLDYLENKTGKKEIRQIQNHLTDCSTCLDELVQFQNFLNEIEETKQETRPEPETSAVIYRLPRIARELLSYGYRWRIAAIAVVILIISTLIFTTANVQKIITRDQDNSVSAHGIDSLYPEENAEIHDMDINFRWRGPQDVAYYTFILLDDEGEIVLESQIKPSEIKIPDSITFTIQKNYFWQVSAHLNDRQVVISTMSQFRYQPNSTR
jgi:hypothetical protein